MSEYAICIKKEHRGARCFGRKIWVELGNDLLVVKKQRTLFKSRSDAFAEVEIDEIVVDVSSECKK